MFVHYAKNLYINAAAFLSSVGLSVVNMIQLFDGILPSLALFVTTCATLALLVYHIRNGRKVGAERRLAELKAQMLEVELEILREARAAAQHAVDIEAKQHGY